MSTDVYIKNIPLSYLKNRPESFKDSGQFNDAISVFNTYKRPVTTDTTESEDSEILPMDTLSAMFKLIYMGEDFIVNDTTLHEDMVFITMTGKLLNEEPLKPRKYISRCSADITSYPNLLVSSLINNPLVNRARELIANSPTNSNPATLNPLLLPKTNNPVWDLRNKAVFYSNLS